MKKLLALSMVLFVVGFAGPKTVAAQGWGGAAHWVHRLGPQFAGGALSVFTGNFGPNAPNSEAGAFRARLAFAQSWAVSSDDFIDPDGSSITKFSINPMLEARFWEPGDFNVAIGAGASFDNFGGDVDRFWHTSYPALLQVGWNVSGNDRWELKAGYGYHYFPAFEATDFDPLVVDVRRTESEITRHGFLGFDVHF